MPQWSMPLCKLRSTMVERSSQLSIHYRELRSTIHYRELRSTIHNSWQDPQVSIGRDMSYNDAKDLARSNQWREKVLVYVTRATDLLVLEHTADYPGAGIRCQQAESTLASPPEAAAIRELFEETGLTARVPPVYLQSCCWPNADAPSRIRHYYWVEAPAETPTAWSHIVSAARATRHDLPPQLPPLAQTDLTPGYGWADALPRLSLIMNQP